MSSQPLLSRHLKLQEVRLTASSEGFDENIPRIFHDGLGAEIKEGSWEILPVFRFLEKWGKVPHREMFNIFNMGIGMVLAVAPEDAARTIEILTACGEKASVIGTVVPESGINIIAG